MADMMIASPFSSMNLVSDMAVASCAAVYIYTSYSNNEVSLPIQNVKYAIATNIHQNYGRYFSLSNAYLSIGNNKLYLPGLIVNDSPVYKQIVFVYQLTSSTFKCYFDRHAGSSDYTTTVSLLLFT